MPEQFCSRCNAPMLADRVAQLEAENAMLRTSVAVLKQMAGGKGRIDAIAERFNALTPEEIKSQSGAMASPNESNDIASGAGSSGAGAEVGSVSTSYPMLSTSEAASLIRHDLRKAFPGQRFSVTQNRGFCSFRITVRWSGGPLVEDVRPVVDRYQGYDFNALHDGHDERPPVEINGVMTRSIVNGIRLDRRREVGR